MKQANHNEVDLLLRSLARGRKQSPWQSGSDTGDADQASSGHLDADELNSYAEGAAPELARARYTKHLADCDACRGIAVSLTQAAGTGNRFEIPEEKRGVGLWHKLSEFLSPKMLGYAIPALLLTAVIGIGFLTLKQRKETQFVAQNEQPVNAPAPVQGKIDSGSAVPAEPQGTVRTETQTAPNIESTKEATVSKGGKLQGEESLKPGSEVTTAAPAKDARQPADSASVVETHPYASEPKAAAPPPPAPLLDAEKSAELAKERPAKREDQARDQDEGFRVQSDDVHGPNRARNNTGLPTSQRGATLGAGRGPSGMDKNKKSAEVETRSVMGRQFTWEGDAWVDTAYEGGATVRVTRGSDQFRALIADEPGIRTIAEQLNGVVIVVWKGRAYRIR